MSCDAGVFILSGEAALYSCDAAVLILSGEEALYSCEEDAEKWSEVQAKVDKSEKTSQD